ncbi:MAG: response regulator transcription factor [Acidobacteria bacterium]|nr:response regulator transcription factor [Acidobacteriota bacterium]
MTETIAVETVAVCDTEPVAIEGIRSLLHTCQDLSLAGSETSLLNGLDLVRKLNPSVVIVDRAFGMNIVADWIGKIRLLTENSAVLVWGAPFHRTEALRLMQAGARSILRKTADLDTLIACIRAAASGGTWLDDAILYASDRAPRTGRARLTPREQQVLELVEQGLKNRDIAETLAICPGTVKIHLKHIFEKTGIRGRYGLALNGLRSRTVYELPAVT